MEETCVLSSPGMLNSPLIISEEGKKFSLLDKPLLFESPCNRERRTKNPKVSRRKEIIKVRAEISEKEMNKMISKTNKTKSWFFEKINKIDKVSDSSKKKKKGEKTQKSIKLEVKKEKLQQTLQKYKRS